MKHFIPLVFLFINCSFSSEIETNHSIRFSTSLKINFTDQYVENPVILEARAVFRRISNHSKPISQKDIVIIRDHVLTSYFEHEALNFYDFCMLTIEISPYYRENDSFFSIQPSSHSQCTKQVSDNERIGGAFSHIKFLPVDDVKIPSTYLFHGIVFKVQHGEEIFETSMVEKPYPIKQPPYKQEL